MIFASKLMNSVLKLMIFIQTSRTPGATWTCWLTRLHSARSRCPRSAATLSISSAWPRQTQQCPGPGGWMVTIANKLSISHCEFKWMAPTSEISSIAFTVNDTAADGSTTAYMWIWTISGVTVRGLRNDDFYVENCWISIEKWWFMDLKKQNILALPLLCFVHPAGENGNGGGGSKKSGERVM